MRGAHLGAAERRLEGVRKLLAEAPRAWRCNSAFGSGTAPSFPPFGREMRLRLRSPTRASSRRCCAPRVTTLANLWAAKRLDIVNGGIFDLVEKRPKVRTRELTRNVSKARALLTAASFLFTPRGEPWPLEAIKADREGDGSQARNKKNTIGGDWASSAATTLQSAPPPSLAVPRPRAISVCAEA